jgi:hypothetical protein
MEIRTGKQNSFKEREKISEIAEILARGIYRLEDKKSSKKEQIQLDNKPARSLHSTDFNTNKDLVL